MVESKINRVSRHSKQMNSKSSKVQQYLTQPVTSVTRMLTSTELQLKQNTNLTELVDKRIRKTLIEFETFVLKYVLKTANNHRVS